MTTTNQPAAELLPCPTCKCVPIIQQQAIDRGDRIEDLESCVLVMPEQMLGSYYSRERATEVWNTHHQPPAVPCTWAFHADAFNCVWNKTECGISDAVFGEEDRFKFCPYCGGKIQRDATTVEEVMNG